MEEQSGQKKVRTTSKLAVSKYDERKKGRRKKSYPKEKGESEIVCVRVQE